MPRTSRVSSYARLAVATSVAMLVLVQPPMAFGQELDDEPAGGDAAVSDANSFGLGELGLGGSVPLDGLDGRAQLTLPVPDGTVPAALNATLIVPAWLDRGWIDVASSGRPLSRIALDGQSPAVPFSVGLAGAAVVDGEVTLDVSTTLIPDGGYCPDIREAPARLIDASVVYSGTPSVPRTIADFLPPVLRQLTVFVPAQPDADVIGAALTLTTSVIDYYGAQTVRVLVRPDTELQGANPDGPFDRSVVLSENNDASAELIFPVEPAPPRLFVTGSGAELLDQTRLITSGIAEIAITTKALAGESSATAVLAPDSTTLDAIGIGTVTGTGTVSVPLDQTRLGRSVAELSVHLIGSYSPGSGSLTASVGETVLAVWPADDTGRLDRWIEIPNAELGRVTTLEVTLEHPAPGYGGCGTQPSSAVTIDGSSVVESSASPTPVGLGFDSLPQALMPEVDVALSENTFANTVRAVSILGGLQRMSTRTLLPHMVSVEDAVAGSDPAIVISPDGNLPDSVSLPLSSTGATTFQVAASNSEAGDTSLTVDTELAYGTVQVTATESSAPLVVASSSAAPAQLDGILGWLESDTSRWFGLTGDILFGAPDIEPVSLSSEDLTGADLEADSSAASAGTNWAAVIGVIVVAALVLLGIAAAVAVWLRSRRPVRRHHRADDDPQAP